MLDRCKLRVLVAVLALTVSAPAVAATGKPRVVLGAVEGEKIGPELKEKLGAAVSRGMQAAGAEIVPDSAAAEPGCDAPCLTAAAGRAGASHVVRGNVEVQGSHYRVRLEMIDGATGQVVDSRQDACEICTEREVAEVAEIAASALKASVFKRLSRTGGDAAISSTSVPPAAPPASVEPSTFPAAPEPAPPPAQPSRLKRWWPWAAIGAGVVASAAGVWLLTVDGDATCEKSFPDQCERLHDTAAGGIALLSGGLIAAAAGGFVLVFGSGSSSGKEPSVAVGPSGILLRGRF